MRIEELLQEGKEKLLKNNIEDSFLIARVLLQFILKIDRLEIIENQKKEIDEKYYIEYMEKIEKIIQGVPLQYITNKQEFYGLEFYVDENVLIPQPDTEILVEEVIRLANKKDKIKVLDICTGSGCIGISLAYKLEDVHITMSDISEKALEIAEINSKNNGVNNKIHFIQSDMFEKIEGKYDIIVSNPPYIETETIKTLSKQVQNEPYIALDGKEDGLFFYSILLKEAPNYLKENGYLCMEIGYNQKEKIIKLAQEIGKFSKIEAKKDLSGNDRVIICYI